MYPALQQTTGEKCGLANDPMHASASWRFSVQIARVLPGGRGEFFEFMTVSDCVPIRDPFGSLGVVSSCVGPWTGTSSLVFGMRTAGRSNQPALNIDFGFERSVNGTPFSDLEQA